MSAAITYSLVAPGEREIVDEERAAEIVETWKKQIEEHRTQQKVCHKISLSDKSYKSEGARVIASFISSSKELLQELKSADLSDIIASRMEEEGLDVLKVICDAFLDANLEEVDLSNNAMGCKGISACASALSGQSSSLKRLSMCNNGLSEDSMNEVADILCEEHEGGSICPRLTKIHFFNNMSGNGGCQAFGRILSHCTSNLTDIRFSGTRAGREGSLTIAQSLLSLARTDSDKGLCNLERLDLADNTFSFDNGGNDIAKALRRCPNIKYLNLRDCLLQDKATALVCRSLWSTDTAVEHLDLSGNEITQQGAKDVADLLEELGSFLQVLHLEENELKSPGVAYIAQSLGTRIEEVRLGSNMCGGTGAHALITAFCDGEDYPNLRLIDLDGNGFIEADVDALKECFGERLPEMDDNDDEEDADADLTDESDEEEDENEEEEETSQAEGDTIKTPERRGDLMKQISKRMENISVENGNNFC